MLSCYTVKATLWKNIHFLAKVTIMWKTQSIEFFYQQIAVNMIYQKRKIKQLEVLDWVLQNFLNLVGTRLMRINNKLLPMTLLCHVWIYKMQRISV